MVCKFALLISNWYNKLQTTDEIVELLKCFVDVGSKREVSIYTRSYFAAYKRGRSELNFLER